MEDAKFNKTSGECTLDEAEIEGADVSRTQQDGIEGAHISQTLKKSSEDVIENAHLPETLEKLKQQHKESQDHIEDSFGLESLLKCPEDEVNSSDMLDACSPLGNNSRVGSINGHNSLGDHSGSKGPYIMDSDPNFIRRIDCKERETEFSPFSLQGWNEPETYPVGAGLANMGNTCFLNAIMQCFIHTVPLVQGLLSLKHESSSHGDSEYCVLCAVFDQIEHSLAYNGRVISPSNLVDNLSYISSFFRRYQQEDAHEFLQCLLDKLDSNWSRYEANANGSSSSGDSLVKQVFGGRLVSQLQCCSCGHNSYTYEPLIDLSLGIEDVDNLESAMKSFTKVESIGDTEKFTCENCKMQVTGEKQLMLDQAPSIATLHLKRFKSDGVYVEKIDKKVEYPLELDLKPYMREAKNVKEELKYDLYAVVVHVGFSSTSGHYFCYIRTAPDTWYRFDDSKVSRVSEPAALDQDAYILFYARKGTTWFSSLFEEWKTSERKILNSSPKSVLDDMDLPSTSKSFGMGLHSCETVEESNAAKGTATESSVGLTHGEVQSVAEIDVQDSAAANRTSPSSSVPYHDKGKADGGDFDSQFLVSTNGKGETSSTSHEASCSSRVESTIDCEVKRDVDINPSTPSRSQSPDIYSDEEPAEGAYHIPLDHLKAEDKALTAKRSMEKAKHDLKRKEAAKYMSKSMPVGRRQLLMAAMMGGSRSESSLNKKRKQASVLNSRHSPKKRAKLSPKRLLRPVAA